MLSLLSAVHHQFRQLTKTQCGLAWENASEQGTSLPYLFMMSS